MEELTLITCSYNTPHITLTMLRSWMHVHNHVQRLILIDNSTDAVTRDLLEEYKIPYISSPGNTHGQGVNQAISLCKTKYALLIDTDVIFLKDHYPLLETFKNNDLTVMGKIEGDRGGKKIYKRVNPWHCFLNIENIKKHEIAFFHEERMKASFETSRIYDIGSTFFEDVKKSGLRIGEIDVEGSYFIHFEGMSWYRNKFDPTKEDTGIDFGGTHNNRELAAAYDRKEQLYKQYAESYNNVEIREMFTYA